MEVQQLQRWNINATVSTPFSLSWSDDNKLAVIGKEGINILELQSKPDNDKWKFGFKRTFAQVSEDNPASHLDIHMVDFVTKLSKADVYNLVLDVALAPHIVGASTCAPSITQVAWSPGGALRNARCLLAVVSSWGQATLLAPHLNQWPVVADLSKTWAEHCQERWRTVDSDEDVNTRYKELQLRVGMLFTRVVAWGQRSGDYTPLVCAQRNNNLVLFRVSRQGKPHVVSCLPSGLEHISAVLFVSRNMLAVGDGRGRVKLLTFCAAPAQGEEAEQVYTVVERDVWTHTDNLSVTHFTALPDALVVFKGRCILAVDLETFSVATHAMEAVAIGGVAVLSARCVLVTSLSGVVHQLSVEKGSGGTLSISAQQLHEGNDPIRYNFGLARSSAGAIWAAVTGLAELKDQPATQLTFYHVVGATRPPVSAVLDNPCQDLYHVVDHLELIRSALVYSRVEGVELLGGLELPENPQHWEALSPYQLRVWRWFVRVKRALARRGAKRDERPLTTFPVERQPLDEVVEQVEGLIAVHWLCSQVTALSSATSSVSKGGGLSASQLLTLHLTRTCLALNASLNPVLVSATLALPQPEGLADSQELCALCGKESSFSSWCLSTCPLQHTLPRCMLTLHQVSSGPYLLCGVCGLVAQPDDSTQPSDTAQSGIPTVTDNTVLETGSVRPAAVEQSEQPTLVKTNLFQKKSVVSHPKCIYCDGPLELIDM